MSDAKLAQEYFYFNFYFKSISSKCSKCSFFSDYMTVADIVGIVDEYELLSFNTFYIICGAVSHTMSSSFLVRILVAF